METDPSLLVTSQVDVNSVVTPATTLDEDDGGKVVIVVNEEPDSLTIPDSVETDPSLLVTSQVVGNSIVISDEVAEIAESVGGADATLDSVLSVDDTLLVDESDNDEGELIDESSLVVGENEEES